MLRTAPITKAAVLLATLCPLPALAIDFTITDPDDIDPAINPGGTNRIELFADDKLIIDIDETFPDFVGKLIFARDESVIEVRDGVFRNDRFVAFGQSSIRVRGGDFNGSNLLALRDDGPEPLPPEEQDSGRIQLFVDNIQQIRRVGGEDITHLFPIFENFTIEIPPGFDPGESLRITGDWANGDHFSDLLIRPLTEFGGTINVWQNFAPITSDVGVIDNTSVGEVQVDLLGAPGEEGSLNASFDPADDGGSSVFTAEYVTGHASQLEQILIERGVAPIEPITSDTEAFDIWFLDYDGSLESGDITLELSFDPTDYTGAQNLVVYHFDEGLGTWEEITGVIDEVNGTITIVTDNLSPFLLGDAGFAIPEPSSLALLAFGGLVLARRRR